MRSLRALKHELGPPSLFVELRPTPHAAIGAPLPLSFEQLPLLAKARLDFLTPVVGVAPLGGWRLGATPATYAAVGGNQHDFSIARSCNERGKAYELVAGRCEIRDCEYGGRHANLRNL